MRSYPRNSPEAAARVLAFALLADGHLSPTELAAVRSSDLAVRLGLDPKSVQDVVHQLVEDLLAGAGPAWDGLPGAEEGMVGGSLDEIEDEGLRRELLALCTAVAQADGHLSEGEMALLGALARRWGLTPCHTH